MEYSGWNPIYSSDRTNAEKTYLSFRMETNSALYMNFLALGERRPPVPLRRRYRAFTFDRLSDEEILKNFRFRREDLPRLKRCLERPSVGLYIHGGTCPILQASRHQWQAGRPTQHSTGTFLAVVCELYRTAFSSTFGTLTDFYSGIISSALSTEPVKCANLALENNFLFSLNYPLLSCGALRIASAHRWDSTSTAGHVRDFRQADNCSKLGDPLNTPPSYTHHDYFRPVSTTVIPSSDIVALFLEEGYREDRSFLKENQKVSWLRDTEPVSGRMPYKGEKPFSQEAAVGPILRSSVSIDIDHCMERQDRLPCLGDMAHVRGGARPKTAVILSGSRPRITSSSLTEPIHFGSLKVASPSIYSTAGLMNSSSTVITRAEKMSHGTVRKAGVAGFEDGDSTSELKIRKCLSGNVFILSLLRSDEHKTYMETNWSMRGDYGSLVFFCWSMRPML
ncbi:unnamed protein product [Nesidiocoris tenuis]|uniref:Uncharacterized protein n=1 Tax=Nesidiocoris tenuis TaxID=355587 RepID=A0A6H5FZG3_9HEMI|nr:unnamed protein product [Nesidiocoris tenuis]